MARVAVEPGFELDCDGSELRPIAGDGHDINLLASERCAREALQFWERL
jgi:hypothetical protein